MNRFASRRRILTLGALGAGAWIGAKFLRRPGPIIWEWQGIVFGAQATILLGAPEDKPPAELFDACQAEALRLESIFTLYDSNSTLRRLNRDGRLSDPPSELLKALEISAKVHRLTSCAFDPTVQPLWDLYQNHFLRNPDDTVGPPQAEIDAAHERVGFEHVRFDAKEISFARPEMALTLNGIAQGFVTDRIAELLIDRGVEHALVNLGEYRAVGANLEGEPWTIGIANPEDDQQLLDILPLRDRSLATSGGHGFRFDASGGFHHIFNPAESSFGEASRSVTVEHPSAAWADALATAGCVMSWEAFSRLADELKEATAHVYELKK
ncbi:MAG: thiamine biosynthesis lipoprotein, partial [Verrucomicrobiales bacterium]